MYIYVSRYNKFPNENNYDYFYQIDEVNILSPLKILFSNCFGLP